MPAGKVAAIIRKVSEHVQLDGSAKLTFEVNDGMRPMQLYCAGLPTPSDGAFHVDLVPRPASCKPRDRCLAEEKQRSSGCGTVRDSNCCGSMSN